jgi:AbrB family looped-hinge helix DNA binding protein
LHFGRKSNQFAFQSRPFLKFSGSISDNSVYSDFSDILMSMKQTGQTMRSGGSCCRIDAIVSVDERGQMVLPKEIREKAGIGPGDKLAVLSWEAGEKVCCISLLKTDEFAGMVREVLGPMMKELSE